MRSRSSVPVLLTVLGLACRDGPVQPSPRPQFSQAPPRVVLTDLGTLGGDWSEAVAINARGQIIGNGEASSYGPRRAFFWDGGTMRDLGTLGGAWSVAVAINDAGRVVGNSAIPDTEPDQQFWVSHAFLWDGVTMRDLGTLGGGTTYASGLNNAGRVVRSSAMSPTSSSVCCTSHAVIWDHGYMRDLGTLGGYPMLSSGAEAINSAGLVVGSAAVAPPVPWPGPYVAHAVLWNASGIHDLVGDTFGANGSNATLINERGQVAGSHTAPSDFVSRAFLWDGGSIQDLGTLGGRSSVPKGINARGEIVGYSATSSGSERAFFWDGRMSDLGALSGGICSGAVSVNAKGQVVGWSGTASDYCYFGEHRRAVLWTVLP